MTRLRRRKSAVIVITCVVSMAIFSTIFISQSTSRTLDGNDDYDVSYGNNARAKIYGADFGAKPMDRKPQAHDKASVENTKIAPIFNYRLDASALQIQASNHRLLARTNTKMDYKIEQSENRNEVEHADTEEDDNPYNYPENPIFKTGDFDEVTNMKAKSNPSPNEGVNGDSFEKSAKDGMRNEVKDNVRLPPSSTLSEYRFKKVEIHAPSDHQFDVLPDRHPQFQVPRLSLRPGDVQSSAGLPIIADFIYWSDAVERLVPKGITAGDVERSRGRIHAGRVRSIQKAQWNRCGRPKNQYIVFNDNSSYCARYRHPHDKLIHGEILSFYLSRMLGLDSVPLVVLSQVNSTSQQWRSQNLTKTEWLQGAIVALIQWIPQLADKESRVKMPTVLLDAYEGGYALNWTHPGLPMMTAGQTQLLLQWSDLILFDYITGNYDRVASMQDGAYEKGTTDIMHEHIRNLRQDWQTNKMWLIDNESGLLDSYELMYTGGQSAVRFIDFHTFMLRSNCVFRESTVGRIKKLAESDDPASVLVEHTERSDPLYSKLPGYSKGFKIFRANFHPRLKQILGWVESCKKIGRTS